MCWRFQPGSNRPFADFARAMAMIIRAQLFGPDNHIVPDSQYNELFAMHGTIMLLLFAT
jgi:heme/copper-type cytochrome/quinol oxidase subunit 1